MIEVELRSFISEEKYIELLEFFKSKAKVINEDFQETWYFAGMHDLRIQKNNSYSKIWMKKGKMHDDARQEIEIKLPRDSFEKLRDLFQTLGYEISIKWFRERNNFRWNGIDISLDSTKGYGRIIEMEILVSGEKEKAEALKKLSNSFHDLKIDMTPKEIFEEKFKFYEKNWRELIN